MKVWQRTRLDERCCGCGVRLAAGVPIQVLTLPDAQANARRRVRCEACAGEPVNVEQLEAFDAAEACQDHGVSRPRASFEFTGATRNLFDARKAQAGDE